MKRKYEKPYLGLESFQLNAAVALSCSSQNYTPINYWESGCTFENGEYFNLFNCQFDLSGPENDGNDSICYHGPVLSFGEIFTYS